MSASGARRVTLPPDDTAPGRARAFLRSIRCPADDSGVLEDAALLVSELVTNAVRHAAPPITLEVVCEAPHGLSIRVTDGSPRLPDGRALTSHEESGRGMALVDVLSEDWGIEPAEPGKAVWFRLASSCAGAPLHGESDGEPRAGSGTVSEGAAGSEGERGVGPVREPTLAGSRGTSAG